MAGTPSPRAGSPKTEVFAGERLGNYEILKRLAAGGMAEIFLARIRKMTSFQKIVVVKRILPQLAQNSEFVEMFLDEARIAATLEHPNIVQTHDVGMIDGSFYIAMEYLHGEDVRSIMHTLRDRGQKLPLEVALHIVINAAAGLHYAHEKVGYDGERLEIVHRDVSPQNLIVTYEGGVKLLDFGIAKASNRLRETRIGTLKGKVPYMSPEQCRSEPLDRRSDIFSIGILLYELTLTRRLYPGASEFEVLKEIVEGEVTPPIMIDPSYPPALNAIVLRALEKKPDNRWQTMRELQVELEKLVRQQQLNASASDVQQFLEGTFGHKIEAWREAQARGKTLDEHLLALDHDANLDTEELEFDSPEEAHARAEREAFLAKIVAQTTEPPPLKRRSGGLALALILLATVAGGGWWLASQGGVISKLPGGTSATESPLPARPLAIAAAAPSGELPAATVTVPKPAVAHAARAVANAIEDLPRLPAPVAVAPPPSDPTAANSPTVNPAAADPTDPAPADPSTTEGAADEPSAPEAAHASSAHGASHHHHDAAPNKKPATGHALPTLPGRPASGSATTRAVATGDTSSTVVNASAGLTPPPAKLEGDGTLNVATSPWCRVLIDGADRGATPLKIKLPAGPHTIHLVNPEFHINRDVTVTIRANEETRKRLDFTE